MSHDLKWTLIGVACFIAALLVDAYHSGSLQAMTRRPKPCPCDPKARRQAERAKCAAEAKSAGRPPYAGGVNPTQPKRYAL